MNTSIDIMAPVGSHESLIAAINAGCNSVYFGLEQLNMRSRSSINFTTEDLDIIVSKCNKSGVDSYLTLNTVLYDHDMRIMRTLIDRAKEAGVTAVIASDHAAISYCKKVDVSVHISTQANVTNIETVEFYAAFADVMVLSRELTLSQVAQITSEIKRRKVNGPSGNLVRIEVFAHGALCMAVSGKCYLSLHSHNASANRGACVQNCRRKYVVTDKDEGIEFEIDNEYIMSAKDLCTIGFLDKIAQAGVGILKIEGRGRSADYVDVTVRCYREALESLKNGTYNAEGINRWMNRLETVYNRGFWDGYYLGRKMGEWNDSYGSKATTKRIFLGRGIKYFGKIKVAEFGMESHSLQTGEKVLITGPTTGVIRTTVQEIRVNNQTVDKVEKGTLFSMRVAETVRPSDKLYKIVDSS